MRRSRLLGALLAVLLLGASSVAPAVARLQDSKGKSAAENEKKEEKKKKSSGRERSEATEPREILRRVLRDLRGGLEALSPSTFRRLASEEKFYDFPRFEEELTVFLRSASELRLFFRGASTEIEGDKGVVIVDAEMIFATRDEPSQSRTRRARVTLNFERTAEGWRITEINPRSFFLPDQP